MLTGEGLHPPMQETWVWSLDQEDPLLNLERREGTSVLNGIWWTISFRKRAGLGNCPNSFPHFIPLFLCWAKKVSWERCLFKFHERSSSCYCNLYPLNGVQRACCVLGTGKGVHQATMTSASMELIIWWRMGISSILPFSVTASYWNTE